MKKSRRQSNMNQQRQIVLRQQIETLWSEVRDLSLGNGGTVERLESPPTSFQFLRNFVSPNKPCIITNAINHWPALSRWMQDAYLAQTLSSTTVSLHLTPNGRADSLVPFTGDLHQEASSSVDTQSLCFASAHVERMPFPEALKLILSSTGNGEEDSFSETSVKPNKFVAYAQQQNDCFRSEYSALASDCDEQIPWATEALGCKPEAVNLWIGNHLSETWFHKDHYENLYAVVSGEKHFLLLPPTDIHRLYIRHYPAAAYSYSKDSGEFNLELDKPERCTPWCSVNPYPSPEDLPDEKAKFPLYFNGPEPFQCTVKAGEILYLPSMWFHHVRQGADDKGLTIAVNYWYDMQFDMKYAYFNFLQSILPLSSPKPTLDEQDEDLESASERN